MSRLLQTLQVTTILIIFFYFIETINAMNFTKTDVDCLGECLHDCQREYNEGINNTYERCFCMQYLFQCLGDTCVIDNCPDIVAMFSINH